MRPGLVQLSRHVLPTQMKTRTVLVASMSVLCLGLLASTVVLTNRGSQAAKSGPCTLPLTQCPYDFTYKPANPTQQGGSLVIGDPAFPQTLNPLRLSLTSEQNVTALLWSACLVQLPDLSLGTGGLKPDQCQKLPNESADLLTTTLHLDPSRVWSDGQPVTADDWLFSLDLITDPNIGSTTFPGGDIASFAKSDATTIVIHWTHANVYHERALSQLYPMPAHAYPQAFTGGNYDSAGAQSLLSSVLQHRPAGRQWALHLAELQ